MKKSVILLVLLLLPVVTAQQTSIYSGTVTPGIYEFASGEEFTVNILGSEGKAIIALTATGFSIENNTCSRDARYEVCADNIRFSHYNHSIAPGFTILQFDLTMYEEFAELSLNRSINQDELHIGNKANYSAIINNPTTETARNVIFTDNLTEHLEIFLQIPSDCTLEGTVLKWKGTIEGGKRKQCYALIEGLKAGTASTTAKVIYTTLIENKSLSDTYAVEVLDYPLQQIISVPENITVGDEFRAIINLTSTHNISLTDLRLKIPSSFKVIEWSGGNSYNGRTLQYDGSFSEGDNHTIEFTLRALASGNHTFTGEYVIFFDRLTQTYERQSTIFVSSFVPTLALLNSSINDGKLTVILNNPTEQDFSDVTIQVKIGIPLTRDSAHFSDLTYLGFQTFTAEFVPITGTYNVSVTATYHTLFGERFTIEHSEIMHVDGIAAPEPSNEPEIIIPAESSPTNEEVIAEISRPSRSLKPLWYGAALLLIVALSYAAYLYFKQRNKPDDYSDLYEMSL